MTIGPGTVGEKTDKAMGRVGNWLGGFLNVPIDWKAFPWKRLGIGAAIVLLAIVAYGLGVAWGEGSFSTTLTITGLTLALGLSIEAIGAAAIAAGPAIGAISQGVNSAIAVGGGVGAANVAGLSVVAALGIVGLVLLAGIVAFVVVPAIVARSTAGAGASGEATDDTAAANLAAAVASFPENPPTQPTVRFSVNPTTGELTITSVDGIATDQGATSNTGCCPGFTTNQEIELSPAITVTPGTSDLPAIGESVPGSEPDASLDASVNASAEGGEYGWIDGICRHYATGLSCAAYQEHEAEEYRHQAAVSSLTTWMMLLAGLTWSVVRRITA